MSSVTLRAGNVTTAGAAFVDATNPGVVAGDLFIAHVSPQGGTGIGTPAGWTAIDQGAFGGLFWKIADSTDAAALTFRFTTTSGTSISAGLSAWYGFNPASPFPVTPASNTGSGIVSPGIVPGIECTLAIFGSAQGGAVNLVFSGGQVSNNNPGTWTQVYEEHTSAGTRRGARMVYSSYNALTDTGAFGQPLAGSPTTVHQYLVAIQPDMTIQPAVLNLTSATLGPTVMHIFLATVLSLTSSVIAPTSSTIAAMWSYIAKVATSWRYIDKP